MVGRWGIIRDSDLKPLIFFSAIPFKKNKLVRERSELTKAFQRPDWRLRELRERPSLCFDLVVGEGSISSATRATQDRQFKINN